MVAASTRESRIARILLHFFVKSTNVNLFLDSFVSSRLFSSKITGEILLMYLNLRDLLPRLPEAYVASASAVCFTQEKVTQSFLFRGNSCEIIIGYN